MSNVKILVAGKEYTGWTSATVRRSIETLCGSFELRSIDPYDNRALEIKPAQPCSIYLDDDLILTGYIDSYTPELDSETRSISVSGRCRTADLVDCAAIYKMGMWKGNVSLLQICRDLCAPFGIVVDNAVGALGTPLFNFSLNPGETVYEAIQRACINRAILPVSDAKGNLVLTSAGLQKASDALMTGYNVKTASGRWEYADRFSEYIVQGQTSTEGGDGWGDAQVTIKGTAHDENYPRYRPKIITADGLLSVADAKKRAAWEMQVRAGKTNTVTVGLVGWRQSTGVLWRENSLVYTVIPEIRVEDELLISEIAYTQSEDGSKISMTLNPPSIYSPEPKQEKKKKGKSEVWGGWG